MSDDLLSTAARALREEPVEHEPARFTRARVMSSLHKQQRGRTRKIAFLLPIAAVLVGSTAFATAGGRLPQAVTQVLGISPTPTLPRPAERAAPLVRRAPRLAQPAPTAAAAPEPETTAAPAPEPEESPKAAASAGVPVDPTHELYRVAHRRHFTESNPAGALAAWDAYLAAAPRGRFATEAQYNRALCLVRLGRNAEARAALEPFAAGRYGGYRQREARELSDALGR